MIGFILYLIVIGLVAGFIARALVPGRDSMSVLATMVLGIVGSFIGGFIGYALTHKDAADGAFQLRASSAPSSELSLPCWSIGQSTATARGTWSEAVMSVQPNPYPNRFETAEAVDADGRPIVGDPTVATPVEAVAEPVVGAPVAAVAGPALAAPVAL